MEKLKIGIIGCGGIAHRKHLPALAKLPEVEMVAFCDIIPERAVAAAGEYGVKDAKTFACYREMLALPLDVVHVLTPNSSHAEITIAALEAGAHVMCEKPMAISSEEGRRIANELIKVGFTDKITLGKQPALELMHRLQDVCNGFEPCRDEENYEVVEDEEGNKEARPKVYYVPLKENPKLDVLAELLAEIDVDNNQTVVWVSRRNAFASVVERLNSLGIPCVSYSGDQTDDEKKEADRQMRCGEARVFVGNPAAAAFGLNFLANCNYMIYYCMDGSVERFVQAQHRILRGQSKNPKFAYVVAIEGSVEEKNMRSLNAGLELLSASNTKEVFEFTA